MRREEIALQVQRVFVRGKTGALAKEAKDFAHDCPDDLSTWILTLSTELLSKGSLSHPQVNRLKDEWHFYWPLSGGPREHYYMYRDLAIRSRLQRFRRPGWIREVSRIAPKKGFSLHLLVDKSFPTDKGDTSAPLLRYPFLLPLTPADRSKDSNLDLHFQEINSMATKIMRGKKCEDVRFESQFKMAIVNPRMGNYFWSVEWRPYVDPSEYDEPIYF